MSIVDKLKEKYKVELAEAEKDLNTNYRGGRRKTPEKIDANTYLMAKWKNKIAKGHYGFDLAEIPFVYVKILDEFNSWVNTQCPDFQIAQQKIKYGFLRCYVDLNSDDEKICEKVSKEIDKLEQLIGHKNLIY